MNEEESTKSRSKKLAKIGIALILISGLLWAPLPFIPFLSISTASKAIWASSLFVGVQIAWWSGAALAGPETVRSLKDWFRSKFRRR